MTLKVRYELTCDFCQQLVGGVEEYCLTIFQPSCDVQIPRPKWLPGASIDQYVACDSCRNTALKRLLEKMKNQQQVVNPD